LSYDANIGNAPKAREENVMKLAIIAVATIALTSPVLLAAAQQAKEPYVPGLGEFMTATQLRHAKLWFAGTAKNWDLAAYEIDEIKEGLEDAAKQVPVHEGIPVADMIKTIIDPALDGLEKAVAAKSGAKFTAAFDNLTNACNTCHAGAKKEFIRIQRPTAPPLTNQKFAPGK
jgi:hypothetical protein